MQKRTDTIGKELRIEFLDYPHGEKLVGLSISADLIGKPQDERLRWAHEVAQELSARILSDAHVSLSVEPAEFARESCQPPGPSGPDVRSIEAIGSITNTD